MVVLNIAEWIANLLILGLAGLVWLLIFFGFAMLLSISNKAIKEFINER